MPSDDHLADEEINQDTDSSVQNSKAGPPGNGVSIEKNSYPDSSQNPISISPSPPKQVTIDQLAEAANSFYKMSLVHEISVDSNFKMERSEAPLEKTIKETMHRAFWDVQRAHLNADPPNYEPAILLLKEFRRSLESLTLPHQSTLRAQITERLDIETVEAQWRSSGGRFPLEAFAEPLVDLLAQWCAPVRDRDVARLRDISDPIEFFRQAFAVLELMHMDLANFTIQKMRPYIRQQAGEYEREKFDKLLEVQKKAGIDGLAVTRNWLREAFEKLQTPKAASLPATGRNSPSTSSASSSSSVVAPTPNNILREAYLELLTWDPNHDYPETMAVDVKRMRELSDCLARTVTLASLVLVVCNAVATATAATLLPRVSAPPISALKAAVARDARGIIDGVPAAKISQLSEVLNLRMLLLVDNWRKASLSEGDSQIKASSAMAADGIPESLKDQIRAQINAVLQGEHPVYKLMFGRAIDFLRSTLSSRPPDPIPLPTGFGSLSESSSSPPKNASTPVPLDPSVCAMERPVPPTAGSSSSGGPSGSGGGSNPAARGHTDLSRVYDLALIASRLMPLVAHNRHVFGPHYAEIIQALLKPGQ